MNSLSWFLYLAEIIPDIGMLAEILAMLIIMVLVLWWAGVAIEGCKKPLTWLYVVAVGLLVFAIIIPSKQTIYLIAGSEAGEYVVTSPEGQEIINDIKLIIKSQIEGLK